MEDVLATVVDLARRKAISITEVEEKGFLRHSTDFVYRREREDVALRPYEQELISAMFGSDDEVRLSDLKNKFYNKLPGIKKKMYADVVQADLFPRNPQSVRHQFGCLAILGIIASVIVSVVLLSAFGYLTPAAVLPGIGLAITAIGLLILARFMPRKTTSGAEAAARWEAFKRYLKDIDQYADMDEQKPIWDRWLPYAIAFGVDKQYIRQFEAVDAPAPGWYIPSPTLYGPYHRRYYETSSGEGPSVDMGGGTRVGRGSPGGGLSSASRGMGASLAGMSVGLGTMLSSAGSTFTSRPSSSSSGGGWSGGGFSGGGSFGGGGGGGGGGGFG
jgi:uncharacterized membrane protein